MSIPSPFELGRAVGGNISEGIRGARDESNLEKILNQSRESQNPQEQQDIMSQVLARIPAERRPEAIQFIQQRQQQIQQANTQRSYKDLAEKIETANPKSSMHKTIADIYRSDLSPEQKEKAIKGLSESTPYKAEQQQRLVLDSVLKRYNSRIKEIDAELKNARIKDRPPLEKMKKDLQSERDQLLNFSSINPKKEVKELIQFDPNNPEHMQVFEQVDAQFNGDRTKVNEALSEMFKL